MSGPGFRGRGSVPRGRNVRGMGLVPGGEPGVGGVRIPQPNFNQPRRESQGPPQDFWLEHQGSVPWQQAEFHHPHSQYPYDPYRYHRGRPQYLSGIGVRGRSKRIRGDGRPRGMYQPGGYQMPIIRPPQPETAKFAPLGSEEERQQKIAETADKLKQKLSSLTVREPASFWDNNLVGVAFTCDDQEQHLVSNRGIPELRHDPPELNLTVSDFKDIGRVDPEAFGNISEAQNIVENETEDDVASLNSEIYLIENNDRPANVTEIMERLNETETETKTGETDQPVAEQLNYALSFEKKISTPEPRVEAVEAAEKEAFKPEEKETSSNHNPELSESLEKLRKVIKIDRELEKKGRAALLSDNRPVFKPSLDFRPEINHGYPRFHDYGGSGSTGESREPRREQSRCREQFWPEYPRDQPQGNFGPDFHQYDSSPRNFRPQGPRMSNPEFGQGPPRMNRHSGRPMMDCDMGYDPRGLPFRFNNFRQEQPRSNSWYDRSDMPPGANSLHPPPAFDPRGPPPLRFLSQEPEPIYGPNTDYAPVLPMGYGRQIPHMHIRPGPYVPMVNGSFNPIMPPPNTAPCIIPEFLPRIPDEIDSQALQPPPPPPPLDEIKLPVVGRGAEKPTAEGPNPTPNMNEELEDMQEALEFAKTLMNMTDEEDDLIQSLNMPTFPDLPPIPSTEPSHLVDQVEAEVGDSDVTETETDGQILEDQTRTKVVFNVNSMNKKLSHSEHWPKQNDENSSRLKKIREKLANPTIPLLKEKDKGSKSPCEEKRERKQNKPDEVPVTQEVPAPEVPTKSPTSSSKASKSLLASTVDANWKDKVINQFLKMSKNDICNMVNSSGLRKFDIAMKHLVKERKYSLSQERRTSADDAVKGACDMSREEFMNQLSAMLDPSATVDVKNLPAKFIQHLSEVLKLDVESHLNEAGNVHQENDVVINNFENGDNHFLTENEQFLPIEEIPEVDVETGHEMEISTDFGDLFTNSGCLSEPVPNMEVLDDIFHEGIARAKMGLKPTFPDVQIPPEIDLEPVPQPYIRARCTKTLMISQSEENVDLDDIFSMEIARVKEAKARNPDAALAEAWGRKNRQDPDLFRNLTKEEWEAKCGNSLDRELEQSRTPSSRETSLGARSRSPRPQVPKNHRLNRNRSPPTPAVRKNSVEPRTESCSSLSSDGESAVPKVTKLLKVIKDREKIGKNLTLGETMRDEVTAEMERDRETEAERKLRKREKCLRRRDRKERLERECRDDEARVEVKLENTIPIKQEELIIEADQEPFLDTGNSANSLSAKSVDKNGETSLAAILFHENNDHGNLKSREMLVAREYTARPATHDDVQRLTPVQKPAQDHLTEAKKPQISAAETMTGKSAVKKIAGTTKTLEMSRNESAVQKPKENKDGVAETTSSKSVVKKIAGTTQTLETICNEPAVQKPKETKDAVAETTSGKSVAKKIETQEIRTNLAPETTRSEPPVKKLAQKEAKVVGAEAPVSKSGIKKIDITVYKARKLQRNFGTRERPKEVVETLTEPPANIQSSKKAKVAVDPMLVIAGDNCEDINNTENAESELKTKTSKQSEAPKVSKPGNKEERKLRKKTPPPKEDKKIENPKGGNEEKVDKRRSRECERSKSREDSRRSSREKRKGVSQEFRDSVKRQDKLEQDTLQNNNVVKARDKKAKHNKDVDTSKEVEKKIEKRQARDTKKKSDDKPKHKERAESPATSSTKNNKVTEVEKKKEVFKLKETKNVDKVPKQEEAEETEEILKQREVKNIEEDSREKKAKEPEEIRKEAQKNLEICVEEEVRREEEAKETPERVRIPKQGEILAQSEELQTKEEKVGNKAGESSSEETKTEEVPQSLNNLESTETEAVVVPQEEKILTAQPHLKKLDKESSDQRENDVKSIDEETPKPQSLDNDKENLESLESKAINCSDNEVKILLNDLIEKAISQLGLLNVYKNQVNEEAKEAEKLQEVNEELEVAPDVSEEIEEVLLFDSEESTIEKKPEDVGTEPDLSSPRTLESPLIGFSEESINSSILGKRKLAQSVLEITEDFVHNKRAKNFDDIMLDMIAESASIPDKLREQISQDRDIEEEAKIEEEIDKLIPIDLGAGCLTPSGDTLSLGSSIDFDQGEFIGLSEISSDENFSQDEGLRPVIKQKLEEIEKENPETETPNKFDLENSEVALGVCPEDKPLSEHLNLEKTEDLTKPPELEPFVADEEVGRRAPEEVGRKTPKVESEEPMKLEPVKKDSAKVVSPSSERSATRNLHRIKHKHKTKHKKDKKYKISEKKVQEIVKDEDIVTLVKKSQTKEVVQARMIEIDIEIHKLMSEKLKLYHMLESGELLTEENPPIVKEKNETPPTLPSKPKSTSSASSKTESRKEEQKKSKKPPRHSEPRKTTEKPNDGRTSVSKKKNSAEDKSASKSSPSQRKEDSARKSSKENSIVEEADPPEVFPKSKKVEHLSMPKKKGAREDSGRKIAKKEEVQSPCEPVNNVLQAQQIYSDESSQLSVTSQQETAKAGNKKGLKGLALLEESYKRDKAISKKRRTNLSRASKKDETKSTSKTGAGALLSSEEDMPLDLLYVKKFRKKPQKAKSTEVLDHVLEVINAVAENKVDEYQCSSKAKPEVEERRAKVGRSKTDQEETQATWHLEEETERTETVICEDERLREVENPESVVEEGTVFSEKYGSEDTNRSDLTERLNHINYDDIPDIDESFVKIEIDKTVDAFHPMVEIHNYETDVVSVASSSGLKRGKRRRRNSGEEGRVLKRSNATSELKSCSVRLVDCKYTYLQSFKDSKTPPPVLEDEMLPLIRDDFFLPEPDIRNSEGYDEDDLEIMRIHAMSLPVAEDEVAQNFCSLEPESLRTLDETEVDEELMDIALDSGGRESCPELPTTEIPVFEQPAEIEEPVVELQVSGKTNEGESHTLDTDIQIVARTSSPSTDEDGSDVQEVQLPKVQYSVHKGPILDVKVFGDSILAASEDGVIYRYSQTCNGILNTYEGHRGAVTCIYVLPLVLSSGTVRDLLFSGSLDGSLRCYDITTSLQVRGAAEVGSPIQCMDQSWGMIYLGTKSGYVFRFHIKSHTFKGDEIKFSEESVLALKATTEGPRRVLIVASRSQPITIRDARDGLFLRTVSGHKTHTVYSLMMDSNLVYCGTSSTAIPVFDFINGSQVKMYNAGPGVVCMRMYKWLLFAGCYDGNIYVFDTKEQKLVCSIPGPGNMLLSMDIVKNKIVAGSKDRRLHMWRMPDQVISLLAQCNNVA